MIVRNLNAPSTFLDVNLRCCHKLFLRFVLLKCWVRSEMKFGNVINTAVGINHKLALMMLNCGEQSCDYISIIVRNKKVGFIFSVLFRLSAPIIVTGSF